MIRVAKVVMSEFVHQNTCKKNKDTSNIEDIDSSDEDELDSILKARSNQPNIIPSPAHKKKASKIVIVDFSTNTPAQRIRQEAINLAIVAAEEENKRKAFS